jgi:hypothetical protein
MLVPGSVTLCQGLQTTHKVTESPTASLCVSTRQRLLSLECELARIYIPLVVFGNCNIAQQRIHSYSNRVFGKQLLLHNKTRTADNALRPSLESLRYYCPEGCLNISPPVPEQCLLAFSASSQDSHRSNSDISFILVCSTLKQKRWQLLPHRYRETKRRNFPFSGRNSSRLSLDVQ